jgi:glycosyltransferase involved in cell wall biosynthesis
MHTMPYRLAVVASHVIQYQDPFYRRLAADADVDLTVFFCSDEGARTYLDRDMGTALRWDLDLLQGYKHRFLRNAGRGDGFFRLVNPGLVPALTRGGFDAALFMTGWAWASAWLGFAACRMGDIPIFLYGDSSYLPPPRLLRDTVLRTLFASSSAFLVSGTYNRDYYRHYGVPAWRMFPMPWAIDNERFVEGSRFAPGERDALRARHGIAPDTFVVIYSGKLIERKDPLTLLRAAARMQHRPTIFFLGDGVLRDPLESFAREHDVDVRFAGFINQTELPRHYALGDVFCLPSTFDPRATVVNEAMACGLPVVITDRCGPAGDIVQSGVNGFVFPVGDDAALATALDTLAADPELRRRMGERSREIIDSWDYDAGITGVKEALRAAGAPLTC